MLSSSHQNTDDISFFPCRYIKILVYWILVCVPFNRFYLDIFKGAIYFNYISNFIEKLLADLKNLRIFASDFGARLLDCRGDE